MGKLCHTCGNDHSQVQKTEDNKRESEYHWEKTTKIKGNHGNNSYFLEVHEQQIQ